MLAERLRDIYLQATSDSADVRELATSLSELPGLEETVLRYTRLFYGRVAGNVSDGGRAVVILGPKVLGHIAVQHRLVAGLDDAALPDGVSNRLWSDWLHRALAARFLATRTRTVHPDLAFTAGLALEWGVGPMLAHHGQHLRWLGKIRTQSGPRRLELERELYGETHIDAFMQRASEWDLPEWLSTIVRTHRLPVEDRAPAELAALHRICAWASALGEAITNPAAGPALEACVRSATALGVHPEDAWQIVGKVLRWTEATAEALDVHVHTQPTVEDLRARTGDYDSLHGDSDWASIVQAENDHLREQVADLRAALARAERQDPITHLPTHDTFLELADTALAQARAEDAGATMLLVDLDDFTDFNTRYGHRVGNRILDLVAQRLRGVTRQDNVIGRVGPDAFAILIPGDVRTAQVVAERARAAIEALHLDTAAMRIETTATVFGVAWPHLGKADSAGSMLNAACRLRRSPTVRWRNRTVWTD